MINKQRRLKLQLKIKRSKLKHICRKKKILKELKEFYCDVHLTILPSAVIREAHVDNKLKNNPEKIYAIENYIRGMSIISLYSFVESNIDEKSIDEFRYIAGKEIELVMNNQLNENMFFIKHIRDTFAHNYTGEMYPDGKGNVKWFKEILRVRRYDYIYIDKNRCLQLRRGAITEIRNIICEYIESLSKYRFSS